MIWLNGALLDEAGPHLHASDRGFAHGDGVFETLRSTRGVAWHAARHFARLRDGAALLGIPVLHTDAELSAAISQCTQADEAAVRITLSRGPGPRGLQTHAVPSPTLLITAGPLPSVPEGGFAIIASGTRRNEFSPLASIKSLNYLDSILARREAVAAGADEAILCNTAGNLAEACAGNLFLRVGEQWFTPPVADGALPGVARGIILEAGLAQERGLTRHDALGATHAFVSSALALRPLDRINSHHLEPTHLQDVRRALQDEHATAR